MDLPTSSSNRDGGLGNQPVLFYNDTSRTLIYAWYRTSATGSESKLLGTGVLPVGTNKQPIRIPRPPYEISLASRDLLVSTLADPKCAFPQSFPPPGFKATIKDFVRQFQDRYYLWTSPKDVIGARDLSTADAKSAIINCFGDEKCEMKTRKEIEMKMTRDIQIASVPSNDCPLPRRYGGVQKILLRDIVLKELPAFRVRVGGAPATPVYWDEYKTKLNSDDIAKNLKEMKGPFEYKEHQAIFDVYLAGLFKLSKMVDELTPDDLEIDNDDWDKLITETTKQISRIHPLASDILFSILTNSNFWISHEQDNDFRDFRDFQTLYDEEVLEQLTLLSKPVKTQIVLDQVPAEDRPIAAWIAALAFSPDLGAIQFAQDRHKETRKDIGKLLRIWTRPPPGDEVQVRRLLEKERKDGSPLFSMLIKRRTNLPFYRVLTPYEIHEYDGIIIGLWNLKVMPTLPRNLVVLYFPDLTIRESIIRALLEGDSRTTGASNDLPNIMASDSSPTIEKDALESIVKRWPKDLFNVDSEIDALVSEDLEFSPYYSRKKALIKELKERIEAKTKSEAIAKLIVEIESLQKMVDAREPIKTKTRAANRKRTRK